MTAIEFGLTGNHRKSSKAAADKGFAIVGVHYFAYTFVQGESSVLRMKFKCQ
jgi:hypothetical protein